MNKAILHTKVQEFIEVNLRISIPELVLRKEVFHQVNNKELAEQISAKRKAKEKLPTWFATKGIYYPPKVSVEQTSSEQTARYKSTLISGKSLLDITGGFGVDSYYFSKQVESLIHCELNSRLSEIASHNFTQLGGINCRFLNQDGVEFVEGTDIQFDWIYLDPSRRNELKGKVFMMSDCLPDVPSNQELLLSKSNNILMKTSPLVDLSQGLSELSWVKEIHVVAVKNEVKELLWVMERGYEGEITVKTVNLLLKENQTFEFVLSEEAQDKAALSFPMKYLYEPNAAILKSGGFNQIGIQLGLNKLHQHSHLYTSKEEIQFPGRGFLIQEVLPAQLKLLKKRFGGTKANITTRNYPQKVEELRKKLAIKDGGDIYLFFTTNHLEEKVCLVCEKLRLIIQ